MSEEWRPIPGYEGRYEASSLGRIRGPKGRPIENSRLSDWGYKQVGVSKAGERQKTKRVHRLVCMAFHPPVEGKNHVNHIDGNKLNNRADNLEWMSKRENEEHAGRLGRHHAITNPKRGWKLSPEDVAAIRKRHAAGERGCDIHKDYQRVTSAYLYKVIRGLKREHDPQPFCVAKAEG